MNRPLSTLLVTLLLLAPAVPAAAADRYLATAEGVTLAFTAEELVGGLAQLLVVEPPSDGTLEVPGAGLFHYTPGADFVGVDRFRLRTLGTPQQPGGETFDVSVSVAPRRMPVAGNWNGDEVSEAGRYDSDGMKLYLYTKNIEDPAWFEYTYAGAQPGWRPFGGDFDDDGLDEIGLYDPSTGVFHLLLLPPNPQVPPEVNQLKPFAEVAGAPLGLGEIPIAGDWSGEGGEDGIGLFVPGPSADFYLWQELAVGSFEAVFTLQAPGSDPVAGDWNGDGQETVGLYDRAAGEVHLRDDHSGGPADAVLRLFGAGGQELLPVAGNWLDDGDPRASLGLFDPAALLLVLYGSDELGGFVPVAAVVHTNPPCVPPPPLEGC